MSTEDLKEPVRPHSSNRVGFSYWRRVPQSNNITIIRDDLSSYVESISDEELTAFGVPLTGAEAGNAQDNSFTEERFGNETGTETTLAPRPPAGLPPHVRRSRRLGR